ncbi:other/FunK1 protein kinase [Coprinopsis cinerea AmutBmut pab1-1]|nr:other/FunK1 protein kinase [Coprinopsis cinerea AmutBmut pab1-1]
MLPATYAGAPSRSQDNKHDLESLTEPIETETPRTTLNRAPINAKTKSLRLRIGKLMNSEIIVCDAEEFMSYYLPKHDMDVFKRILTRLSTFSEDDEEKVLIPRDDPKREEWLMQRSGRKSNKKGKPKGASSNKGGKTVASGSVLEELDRTGSNPNANATLYSHVFSDFMFKPSLVKRLHEIEKLKERKSKKSKKGKNTKDTNNAKETKDTNSEDNAEPAHENTLFNSLGKIGDYVLAALKDKGVTVNEYHLRMCPNTTITSGVDGCNHKIDACLTKNMEGPLSITDIIVAFEFKVACSNAKVFENRGQLVSHVVHTMNDDARRLFMYGITIEDDLVSIWFFSRSHSAKATVFSMVERPDFLIRVLVSLFCATDEQLGLDPLVSLVGTKDFLYRFPPSETRDSTHYYLTIHSITEYRSLHLRGRSSRVWKVKRVYSAENHERMAGTTDMILKDLSLSTDTPTEAHIQGELFKDIGDVLKDPNWREREILRNCSKKDLDAMAEVLKDENSFMDFFSCIAEHHTGVASLPVWAEGWRLPVVFEDPQVDIQADAANSKVRVQPPSRPVKASVDTASDKGKAPIPADAILQQPLEPRHQFRAVYNHIYTPLHNIMTLGEAVDIIKGCVTVLRVMFCAGWVHRDISAGNILAARAGPTGPWQVKLADLEYAKRFPPDRKASVSVKSMTTNFMPCEVGTSMILLIVVELRSAERKALSKRSKKVIHGFQHDLESIWWLLFWLISMRVDEALPRGHLEDIFQDSVVSLPAVATVRRNFFTQEDRDGIHLNVEVRAGLPRALQSQFLESLDDLRCDMVAEYHQRNREMKQQDIDSYSRIIADFGTFFDAIEEVREQWHNIKLVTDLELHQRAAYRKKEELIVNCETVDFGVMIAGKRPLSELFPATEQSTSALSTLEEDVETVEDSDYVEDSDNEEEEYQHHRRKKARFV